MVNFMDTQLHKELKLYVPLSYGYNRIEDMLIEVHITKETSYFGGYLKDCAYKSILGTN
jgi:hypothetical protein